MENITLVQLDFVMKKYPTLRIGQIISNCAALLDVDPFYMKDEDLQQEVVKLIYK